MILGNIRDMLLLTTEEYIVEIISIMIYSARQSNTRNVLARIRSEALFSSYPS